MSQSNFLYESDEQIETDVSDIAEHFNSKIPALSVGDKVKVYGKLGERYSKVGVVTSLAKNLDGATPIHVTFEGESFETDFKAKELYPVFTTDESESDRRAEQIMVNNVEKEQ